MNRKMLLIFGGVGLFLIIGFSVMGRGQWIHSLTASIALGIGLVIAIAGVCLVVVSKLQGRNNVSTLQASVFGFAIVFMMPVLSLPIGGFIHQWDIQKAIGYCDSLMPLLEEEKNKTGSYPVDLQGVLKNRDRSPYLLSLENYYLSDGLSFVFSFSERDGVFPHVNLYSSERKKWETF